MNKRMTYSRFSRRAALAGMAVLALLASCSQDTGQDDAQDSFTPTPISFTASGLQVTPTTRATVDGTWEGVTYVAVQIYGESTKLYSVTPSDDYKTATLTTDDPLYWQSADDYKIVDAWLPYNTDYSEPEVAVKADQSSLENYQASDFIEASADQISFSDPTITFYHRTAKVVVKLTAGDGVSDVSGATVKLLNTLETYIENYIRTGITAYNPDNGTTHYALLGTPQRILANTKFIQVTLDGQDYYYAPTAEKSLDPSCQHTYTLRVSKTGLSLEGSTIEPWGTDSGTDNAGMATNVIDLSTVTSSFSITSNTILTGECNSAVTININEGADEVIFNDATFAKNTQIVVNTSTTIHLMGTNAMTSSNNYTYPITVTGGTEDAPHTLTITGDDTDKLTIETTGLGSPGIKSKSGYSHIIISGGNISITTGGSYSTAIGGTLNETAGDITISGGTVTATTTGIYSPAIGASYQGKIGNITISGGEVIAKGARESAAAIGCTLWSECGDISITGSGTKVTATTSRSCNYDIGPAYYSASNSKSTCGIVTIGDGVSVQRDDEYDIRIYGQNN